MTRPVGQYLPRRAIAGGMFPVTETLATDVINHPCRRLTNDEARAQWFSSYDRRALAAAKQIASRYRVVEYMVVVPRMVE